MAKPTPPVSAALCLAIAGLATSAAAAAGPAQQYPEVVERLRQAQRIALASGALPFAIQCSDEDDGTACEGGGRQALAGLDLDRIGSVSPIYNISCVRVVFEYPGDQCPASVRGQPRTIVAWEIRLPHAAGGGMTWTVGLAPADAVETVHLERGLVIYH